MMGGVSPKTCWAIKKHWNNKFYYKVASCWFFLWDSQDLSETMLWCQMSMWMESCTYLLPSQGFCFWNECLIFSAVFWLAQLYDDDDISSSTLLQLTCVFSIWPFATVCTHSSSQLNIVWCSKILCWKWSFLVSLPAELITSWSWDEGTSIPQNHRNQSSSNRVSHPRRLELFSNTPDSTYISSTSWPYMIKLAFSNDTEGHFSGSCSGVYRMNYVITVQLSDGHW